MSTYSFVGNNPIRAIDPNGKEIIITESINEETGKTKLKIELSGKVVFDYLSTLKSPEQKQKYVDNLNTELSNFFSISFENMEVEFESKMTIGTVNDIEDNDHVIYSMNLHVGTESKGFPSTVGGFVSGIGSKKAFFPFNINDYSIPIHEIGHWLGLLHPKDIASSLSKYGTFDPVTLEDKKYDYNDVFNVFSSDNFMHHGNDTKQAETNKGTFDEIQAKIIQAVNSIKGLNQGTNKKEGNLKSELENSISNSRATGKNKEVVGEKLDTNTKK